MRRVLNRPIGSTAVADEDVVATLAIVAFEHETKEVAILIVLRMRGDIVRAGFQQTDARLVKG